MPTYQYACRNCEHQFEATQGFHEEALRVCPECEAEDLRKLFGNVGVVFKGSGFYRTDSRSAGKTGASSASKSETKTTSNDAAATSSTTKPSTTSSSTS